MALLVSNGATNLSTVNGFYRAEAFNVGLSNSVTQTLGTIRTIPVTFANAGNCQGIILALSSFNVNLPTSAVVVTLQQNIASVWTTVSTVTTTTASIINATDWAGIYLQPFILGTPIAVTTAASTWRFQVIQSPGNAFNLATSDGTNPFYVTWCDNALSFTSGADAIVCKDVVTIDQTASLVGILGTGDTVNSIAALVCNSTTPAIATVSNLVWQNPPVSSYTLTINGCIIISSHGGFRVGTSTSRIPSAQQAIINFVAPSLGTQSGIKDSAGNLGVTTRKGNIFLYGQIPSVRRTSLAVDAIVGATTLTVNDTTNWLSGDSIFIGKQDVAGTGDTTLYSLNGNAVGTTITITPAIATNVRKAAVTAGKVDGNVIRINGYGVKFTGPTSGTRPSIALKGASNIQMDGVEFWYMSAGVLPSQNSNLWSNEDAANRAAWNISNNSAYANFGNSGLFGNGNNAYVPPDGMSLNANYVCNVWLTQSLQYLNATGFPSGVLTMQNNIQLSGNGSTTSTVNTLINNTVFSGNVYENAGFYFVYAQGANITFTNNYFWGNSRNVDYANGCSVPISNLYYPAAWSGNTYNKSCAPSFMSGAIVGLVATGETFGNEAANAKDVLINSGAYIDAEFVSCVGSAVVDTQFLNLTVNNTNVKFANYNSVTNDDRGNLTYGFFQRCGTGLSDTLVRTAGGFSMRFQPTSGTNLLKWAQTVPTGNLQNKTMTISVWVYINSANYYSGTHTNPTLSVNYDNGTTVTAVATNTAGSWQQLAVNFTPATTYGSVTVTIQGATDQATTSAYFYLDDFNVNYPAGVVVNNGTLDSWSHALPVTPTTTSIANQTAFWDELTANHSVTGSFGSILSDTLTESDFIGLK